MQQPNNLSLPDAAQRLAKLTEDATGLGRETVDIGGFLHDLDDRCRSQIERLDHVKRNTGDLAATSAQMLEAVQRMAGAADDALERVRLSTGLLGETGEKSQALAEWVRAVHAQGPEVEDMLLAIQVSNSEISDISWQVKLLAVNAKIEAARAGHAGKGFSIVADAVNELSQKTTTAADAISGTVKKLSEWMGALHRGAESTSKTAEAVLNRSADADTALTNIESRVAELQGDAHELTKAASRAQQAVDSVAPAIEDIANSVTDVAAGVDQASTRCDSLVDGSESILQEVVALGGNGQDGPMITMVQDLAGRISEAFEKAVATGQIGMNQLFSSDYRPVPGSDPEQVLTPFTALTDAVLPDIQEPVLALDPRIVFCAAVDRNGYLPTHNTKFGQPQGDDPVWNAAHCRNRRIFDDRVGLKAGRSEQPFLLQVYRRDMGGGTFVMMKDLSAPIFVQGRHWGGLRLAYKF
ncbi:methyl-accepting chemotaxis protein [Tropicibacter oceani]|uniref:Methyl-accepting chemotaxis protein n=1 Tax=Tropicibacter oceani TaxID=3058420 RepID=A0ABY8QF64_9RHOB|nr:methyl-accepting chemotaxis protein [Tropicibacter oceani]WGW02646.1 methyl-accepting chemotaxis protein [Tropicibacter oceani]